MWFSKTLVWSGQYLSSEDEVVIPEVSNPEDETELSVPQCDDCLGAEDDSLLPQLGSRQLGEDQADHEGLDQTSEN